MPKRGGGKRRKRRTHFVPSAESEADGIPRSLVLARGKVPMGVRDLITDLRSVFMPYTAQKLRERKSNSLRDYVAVAAQLHITHIWMFSATERAPYLRVGRIPQGPTLTFRLCEYTLAPHVRATQKRPVLLGDPDLAAPPLLVMNNFGDTSDPGVKLMAETLRHCFPPIDVNSVRLAALRRVLLIERDSEDGLVRVRHYALRVHAAGLSRPVRKMVVRGRVPKLARLDDVAELMEGAGPPGVFSSDSEIEDVRGNEEVKLPQDVKSLRKGANSKVRLVEVGPRLTLELVKVEAGLCNGAILYHKHVKKSVEEVATDQKRIDEREALRKKRRMDQEANVERKEHVKRARKERRKERAKVHTASVEKTEAVDGDIESGAENSDRNGNENSQVVEAAVPSKESLVESETKSGTAPADPTNIDKPSTKKVRRGGRRAKSKKATTS